MDLGFDGKVAVVTGASKGIGLAVAEAFAGEGARVVTGSRSGSEALDELAGRFPVMSAQVDLSTPEGPAGLVRLAVEEFGGVDVLVNNVGNVEPRTAGFAAITDEDWQRTFDLNVMSAVRASRAALPLMVERGDGAVVNVSSLNARLPQSPVADYAAAKAAMTNLSKLLAEEFGPQGVRVNTVSPGPVRTPLWEGEGRFGSTLASAMGADTDTLLQTMPEQAGITLGRFVEAEEVADLILWLASERASGVIGADYAVDGGMGKTT